MARALLARTVILILLTSGWLGGRGTSLQAASDPRGEALSEADRATLLRYARDTWRSFDELALPSGLPADALIRTAGRWSRSLTHTSPTNIARATSGASWPPSGWGSSAPRKPAPARPHAHDAHGHGANPWFLRQRARPAHRGDPQVPAADPATPPPPLRGGQRLAGRRAVDGRQHPSRHCGPRAGACWNRWTSGSSTTRTTRRSGPPSRPVSRRIPARRRIVLRPLRDAQHGGADRQLPRHRPRPAPRRALLSDVPDLAGGPGPAGADAPRRRPASTAGSRSSRARTSTAATRIVPSWGGSMFEALMVTLFVPEERLGPAELGGQPSALRPGPDRARAARGRLRLLGLLAGRAARRGATGIYGVDELGTSSDGYLSFDPAPPPPSPGDRPGGSPAAGRAHGVVTPHASFLALRYRAHARRWPTSRPWPPVSRSTRPWDSSIRSTSPTAPSPARSWRSTRA